jgi:hypothetical protein
MKNLEILTNFLDLGGERKDFLFWRIRVEIFFEEIWGSTCF